MYWGVAMLRGEASVVAAAVMLGVTLAVGTMLLVYAFNTSASMRGGGLACLPSMLETPSGVLVYNACEYNVTVVFKPRGYYNVTTSEGVIRVMNYTLTPGEAILVEGSLRGIVVGNVFVPVERG